MGSQRRGDLRLQRAHLRIPAVGRERRRHQRQAAHDVRVLHGQPQRDAAAERIAEHVDLRAAEPLQQRRDVVGDRLAADRAVAQRRAAVALQVDGDQLAPRPQDRQERLEHVAAAEAAVQEQQRVALPADLVVVVDAFEGDAAAGLRGRGRSRRGRGRRRRRGRGAGGGERRGNGNQRQLQHRLQRLHRRFHGSWAPLLTRRFEDARKRQSRRKSSAGL